MTDDPVSDFKIVVRRVGAKEIMHSETFTGTRLQVERRAGDIWNFPYAGQPGRFRLRIYTKGERRPFMTIG